MTNCKKCDRPVDMYSKTGLCTYHLMKLENVASMKRKEVFFRTMSLVFFAILASLTLIAGLRINYLATVTSYFYILYISALAVGTIFATYYYRTQSKTD